MFVEYSTYIAWVNTYQVEFVFSLGTPSEVKHYLDNTYAFLFDLDGTIVLTDDIYFEVWREILSFYNIILTHDIFNKYIIISDTYNFEYLWKYKIKSY